MEPQWGHIWLFLGSLRGGCGKWVARDSPHTHNRFSLPTPRKMMAKPQRFMKRPNAQPLKLGCLCLQEVPLARHRNRHTDTQTTCQILISCMVSRCGWHGCYHQPSKQEEGRHTLRAAAVWRATLEQMGCSGQAAKGAASSLLSMSATVLDMLGHMAICPLTRTSAATRMAKPCSTFKDGLSQEARPTRHEAVWEFWFGCSHEKNSKNDSVCCHT
jgi:hypothetical protein